MRVRLVVSGRVQGVGFRWFIREAARHIASPGGCEIGPTATSSSKCQAMTLRTANSSTRFAKGRQVLASTTFRR